MLIFFCCYILHFFPKFWRKSWKFSPPEGVGASPKHQWSPSTSSLFPVNIFHWSEVLKLQNTKYGATCWYSWPFHAFSRDRKTSRTILLGLQVCGESVFLSICSLYFLFHHDCSIYSSAIYYSCGSALLFISHTTVWGIFCPGLSVSWYEFLALFGCLFSPNENSVCGSSICLNAEILLPEKGVEKSPKPKPTILIMKTYAVVV